MLRSPPYLRALAVACALAAFAGCASVLGADFDRTAASDDAGPNDASDVVEAAAAESGSADANARDAADAAPSCPGTAGPVGVRIHADAGSYCIDSTEVTRAQYGIFAASVNPSTFLPPTFCAWQTSYVPNNWSQIAHDDHPVTNVTWCDAYMYCAWAGKRLCGKQSRHLVRGMVAEGNTLTLDCPAGEVVSTISFASWGTPVDGPRYAPGKCHATTSWSVVASLTGSASLVVPATTDSFGEPCYGTVKSLAVEAYCGPNVGGGDPHTQWGSACTSDDETRVFPYGKTYDPVRCNGKDVDGGDVVPVESFPRCQGAFDGVYDLSGNATEWVDSCDTGDKPESVACALRGGSYVYDGTRMRCDSTYVAARQAVFPDLGFRCCSIE